MKKILNLFLLTILIYGCQTSTHQSYQKVPLLAKSTKIAILLPLSQERGIIGNMMNDFIQLGLSYGAEQNIASAKLTPKLNKHGGQIQIASYDMAGGIEHVIDSLLKYKPDIILGPIFSSDTKKISQKLLNTDAVIISLSNDSSIAKNQIYTFGALPIEQIKQMCTYLKSKGVDNMILLAPDIQESQQWINAVNLVAKKNQIHIVESKIYQNHIQSIQNAAEHISSQIDEINENIDSLSKVAIYVANDKNLALVFDALTNYHLDKKAIICGNHHLDIKYDRPIDIIFTGSRSAKKLSKDLQNAFSSEQSSRSVQQIAFDLGLITSYAIGMDEFNKVVFESKFTQKQGYKCLAGVIKITNNCALRKYKIIKRSGSSYEVLSH